MVDFKIKLFELFKQDIRLWDKDKKEFNETLLKDLIDKLDEKIIELLLGNRETKEKFFIKVKDVFVLKQNELKFFIDENKIDNSYTQYKNKIGLRVGNKLLSEIDEVVLDWPFKDCVLEGGMTKEDQKRNEIFFNEVLAKDEIDRLYEPKVIVNWKRYIVKGEEEVKEIKRDKDGTIRENLVIKGNNLLALHSLKEQFAGKVKLIYIDPPYNTGNDSFGYNDNFNHSTWLVFMRNRLKISQELLSNTGLIFVQCDDNEQAYLKILMDEVFGRNNFISSIAVVSNPGGRDYGGIARTHEYLLVYANTPEYEISNYVDKNKKMPYKDNIGKYDLRELRNRNIKFNIQNRPNLCYPFYINSNNLIEDENLYEVSLEEKDDWIKLLPKKSQNVQTVWRWGKDKVLENLNINALAKKTKKGWQIVEKYRDGSRMARSVWMESEMRNEFGTLELKKQFAGEKTFDYPKSEYLIMRIIEIGSAKNDIVLDYHIGSGTTCAVAHKMGRQYIGIEQLDYGENDSVKRLQNVINGDQSGISKTVNWQSGGDFVYFELAKWNEKAKEEILGAKSLNELEKLFDKLYKRYFLNYNVKTKEFKEKIIKEKEFLNLTLDEQKQLFIEMLDMNQMYVNFSERNDEKYGISPEDIALSEDFYNAKK
ncbi:MAG: site-specific DNA-methyltransferase [Deltaproteobacteria bacterium]|nr:site-specific DNA-methyltransferase [Deltaproteobacteria bacterium]